MRILAVEPLGYRGHISFDAYFVRVLKELGHVALATFPSYQVHLDDVDTRFEIPERLASGATKLASRIRQVPVLNRLGIPERLAFRGRKLALRIRQVRILNHIRKNVPLDEFDAIVFLVYETISFALRWPKTRKVFLFEHDNLENALRSRIRMHFFRRLPARAVHLPFLEHVVGRIDTEYGRRAVRIPHPHYRYGVTVPGAGESTRANAAAGRKTILSPSWSTPLPIQAALKRFVSERPDYYLICKGPREERTGYYEQQPYFDHYESLLRTCDMLFHGGRFDCRASGCAHEALSYGKPVVLFDSPFGRQLRAAYPGLVFLIDEVADLSRVTGDPERARRDQARFLKEHSYEAIRDQLAQALRS